MHTPKPRLYQENILNTCIKNNCLVVLPTGTGKTLIAVLLAIERIKKYPKSKILILAPSRPLVAQHYTTFKNYINLEEKEFALITGKIKPKNRKKIWENSRLVFSTPQCIKNDLVEGRISLSNVSLVVFDEAHHGVQDYAYVYIANEYKRQAREFKVLALTASPGGTKEKIDEICSNLGIDAVEIRTERDEDIKYYIKEKVFEWVPIELPEGMKKINKLIKKSYKERVEKLKNFDVNKAPSQITKKDLIAYQNEFLKKVKKGYKAYYSAISLTSQALKLSYASELLETQGLIPLQEYWEKLEKEVGRTATCINFDKNVIEAKALTKKLLDKGINHPKMEKLIEIVKKEFEMDKNTKIMIFANYRTTVEEIVKVLSKIKNAKPVKLVGQREGMTQKEQIERLRDFANGKYNILVGTCIIEEGLDVTSAKVAIFFDIVPSEIRKIQRIGRVGRTQSGKIIFLMTKNSRDQAYYWSAKRKEKLMRSVLKKMGKEREARKLNLLDFF